MDTDIRMTDAGSAPNGDQEFPEIDMGESRKFVISVDFGTTCSSVAYVGFNSESQRNRMGLEHVEVIDRFPSSPMNHYLYQDVPTEICYQTDEDRRMQIEETLSNGDDSSDVSDEDGSNIDDVEHNLSTSKAGSKLQPYQPSVVPPSPALVYWGFEAQERRRTGELNMDNSKHLSRFKLILDTSSVTEPIRKAVKLQCQTLKDQKSITEDLDVISSYLGELLSCVKRQLVRDENYQDREPIEFVLCVPAAWKSSALRSMQLAMSAAIEHAGLGNSQGRMSDSLFLVSEPEAAAACMLAAGKTKFKLNETFMVLDAGGGTVDAVTYRVERKDPLRLTEIAESRGELCGSSFINERFQDMLEEKLKGETYLEENGETLASIIDDLVIEFERSYKRRMDELQPEAPFKIKVPGLRANKKRRFEAGRLVLTNGEVEALFGPSLRGVADLMHQQLAATTNYDLEKIILVGGFGQSERLEKHLREELNIRYHRDIKLMIYKTQWSAAAVARGGVLRALRKEDGPSRCLQSSYGFVRTEPCGQWPEHLGQVAEVDKIDGQKYVVNTIDWVLTKGETIPAEYVIDRPVEHTFGIRRKNLVCSEFLYVSDNWHPSHYHMDHRANQGRQVAGKIVVDLTYLKNKVHPVKRQDGQGAPYWKICFTLRITVNGRSLKYEVIPKGEEVAKESETIPIAAAFVPGTE